MGRRGGCAAICDPAAPRQTPTTSRSHVADWVPPGVTLLLLFCCCYLFTEAVRWDDEGELCLGCQERSGVVGGRGGFCFFFFFCGDLAAAWRAAESRSSQRTEGERGRAICGTDMVDECQVVPGADGAEADLILSRSAFSHSDLIWGGRIYSCYCAKTYCLLFGVLLEILEYFFTLSVLSVA